MLYENSKYRLDTVEVPKGFRTYESGPFYYAGYAVINRETGITEHICATLPEAISSADGLEYQLADKPWIKGIEFARKQTATFEQPQVSTEEVPF